MGCFPSHNMSAKSHETRRFTGIFPFFGFSRSVFSLLTREALSNGISDQEAA